MNERDAIHAIETRLAELDAIDLERERGELLADLDAGQPVPTERVVAVAMADLVRAEAMPEAAWTLAHRALLAAMLDTAGIQDHVPFSFVIQDGVVTVESASRGRVAVGPWDAALVAELEREVLVRERAALIAARKGRKRPGPPPASALPMVEEARRALASEGRPSGERSIAQRLGVSRGAVRHAQGKDRRTGP
jgi:hypothetical protein